jgi:hypothetical protein
MLGRLSIASWCESKDLELHAILLPGVSNVLADAESRRPLSSGDWMLSVAAFKSIPPDWKISVDLFASEWNTRLPKFVSWFPQPGAWKTDAFSMNWRDLQGYAFPPFGLIPNCLSILISDKASVIMITPYWPSQAWFPSLLQLTVDIPRLLMPSPNILSSPLGGCHPLTLDDTMRLIVWKLSGSASEPRVFRQKLLNFS